MDMITSGFDKYVGMSALADVEATRFCKCKIGSFGPNCNQSEQEFTDEFDDNDCQNGVFDAGNTLTGCSCRESIDGNATEFHGWYCERPNRFEIIDLAYKGIYISLPKIVVKSITKSDISRYFKKR